MLLSLPVIWNAQELVDGTFLFCLRIREVALTFLIFGALKPSVANL